MRSLPARAAFGSSYANTALNLEMPICINILVPYSYEKNAHTKKKQVHFNERLAECRKKIWYSLNAIR